MARITQYFAFSNNPMIVLVTEIDKRVFCDVTKKIGSTEVNKM